MNRKLTVTDIQDCHDVELPVEINGYKAWLIKEPHLFIKNGKDIFFPCWIEVTEGVYDMKYFHISKLNLRLS